MNWGFMEAIGTIALVVVTTGLAVATVWMAYISKKGLDAEEERKNQEGVRFYFSTLPIGQKPKSKVLSVLGIFRISKKFACPE